MTESARKRGARDGNTLALRHGLRSGKMPPNTRHIERSTNEMRVQLEGAVVAAKQQVSLLDAATIQTVCRWERHAQLAMYWLRKHHSELDPTERLHFSREHARASAERDKALDRLGLDRRPGGLWDGVDHRLIEVRDGDATEYQSVAEGHNTSEDKAI